MKHQDLTEMFKIAGVDMTKGKAKQLCETVNPNTTKIWLDTQGIKNYNIKPDGTVDVVGDVDLHGLRLATLQFSLEQ